MIPISDGERALMLDLYTSRCTIQKDMGTTLTSTGQAVEGWQTFSDYADLPCKLFETGEGNLSLGEVQQPVYTVVRYRKFVGFLFLYEDIEEHMHAVVDGETYNIVRVSHNLIKGMTRLEVELVEALQGNS